jgi:hypothetical protein
VKIGEFISDNLEKLFNREERLLEQYEFYCRQHSKELQITYCLAARNLFILEIYINDKHGNNGEIKDS